MRRSSVVIRLWLVIVGLIIAVLVPLEFALHGLLTNFYTAQVIEPMLYHSRQLAAMLAIDQQSVELAPMVGRMVGAEVVVMNHIGGVYDFPDYSEPQVDAASVSRVLSGGMITGQMLLEEQPHIMTGVPIPEGGGAVFLIAPAAPVQQSLTVAKRYLWAAGVAAFLVGTGLALVIARTMVRPVREMEQATKSVAQGNFSVRVAVLTDDEIGQLGRAINQMTAQLDAYETRRREFLANVAHELRTPLSYIRGYSQVVAEDLIASPAERDRYLRIVHEEAVRISRLVDDLMDLAQLEEGQLDIDRAPLDLRLPIGQAAATVRPAAEARGVGIRLEVDDGLPRPMGDSRRIQQVVFNLLDNGLRHAPEGSELVVTTHQKGEEILVQVADQGPGIDPDLIPVIFERFQKRHSEGRGLGLAIVRSIVRAHGGEVGVSSHPGQGSTFWFRLPCPDCRDPSAQPQGRK